ncbi:hypothetical protein LAV76_15565 [Bacillus paramobilis]|uniref:hypothetical protein n=1 Tax=Bacillus paramobilis TaxID=2817477 RepID=UPI0030CA023C
MKKLLLLLVSVLCLAFVGCSAEKRRKSRCKRRGQRKGFNIYKIHNKEIVREDEMSLFFYIIHGK